MQRRDFPKRILVLNGPNLGSLGTREPAIYGAGTLEELIADLTSFGERLGVAIEHAQTDDEAELIGLIARADADALVLNPGALTHTSRTLGDAVRSSHLPTVEVHISDPSSREPWRAVSTVEDAVVATICGRGRSGYRDAVRHLVNRWAAPFQTLRYGPHQINVGERRPGQGLVVLIHGGIWRRPYGRDSMESLAVDLHGRGIGTWNIGYRRLGEGGGWPGSGQDVLTALDHASSMTDGPIVVLGHSAGGYLGMWAAERTSTPVALSVALAPIADLDLAVSSAGELSREAAILLDEGAPARPGPVAVRTMVVHGARDSLVPREHTDHLAHLRISETDTSDLGHFELLDPAKAHWSRVVEDVTEALDAAVGQAQVARPST